MRDVLSPAAAGGIGAGIVLLVVALAVGRIDIGVAGVVLVCATAAALTGGAEHRARLELTRHPPRSGEEGPVVVPVTVEVDAGDAEIVLVTATAFATRTRRAALAGPAARTVLETRAVHSGEQDVLEVETMLIGPDGVWTGPGAPTRTLRARIEPRARTLPFLPLPHVRTGLTGAHDASRPGEGGEFRDIHPFAPGDRLRRIDWKATARLARRPEDLFVRRTMATSDVDVAILLDDAEDITGITADWARGDRRREVLTSLDIGREAAWSLACAYLAVGDQVSFQVLSRLTGSVSRGSGARHRERLRTSVTGVTAQTRVRRRRTPAVAPGALVVLMSTFLDDEPLRLAGLWRASGHRVLAVDTLPRLRSERLGREEQIAMRIILGMRADRLRAVRATGADLLVWDQDHGGRIADLRTMSRTRRRR